DTYTTPATLTWTGAYGTSSWAEVWNWGNTYHNVYVAEQAHGDVKIYEGPGDPTYQAGSSMVSYLANADLFDSPTPFTISNIPDGESTTIFFAEGYAGYCYTSTEIIDPSGTYPHPYFQYYNNTTRECYWNLGANSVYQSNTPPNGWTIPWTSQTNGPVFSHFNDGVTTFEVRPTPAGWTSSSTTDPNTGYIHQSSGYGGFNASLPQGNFAGGILVAMGDGSVHHVNQAVSWASWVAACTPQGNDMPGGDW